MCVNKLRREGATGVGFPTEKLEHCAAIAGRTQASIPGECSQWPWEGV